MKRRQQQKLLLSPLLAIPIGLAGFYWLFQKFPAKSRDFVFVPPLAPALALASAHAPAADRPILPFQGLLQDRNSCYMDSLFMALFAVPNETIDQAFLLNPIKKEKDDDAPCLPETTEKIRQEIIQIVQFIRGSNNPSSTKTCGLLRQLFYTCQLQNEANFAGGKQQDPGEFLLFLLELFQINVTEMLNLDSGPTTLVRPVSTLTIQENESLADYEVDPRLVTTPFYFFLVQRPNFEIVFVPTQQRMFGDKVLYLKSLVVYRPPRHYVCCFRYFATWFYYNDLKGLREIGDFQAMLADPELQATQFATVFVYSEADQPEQKGR